MSIYLNKNILLELKRNINGVEEDLGDETEESESQSSTDDNIENDPNSNIDNEDIQDEGDDSTEVNDYNIDDDTNNTDDSDSNISDDYTIEDEGDDTNDLSETDDDNNNMDSDSNDDIDDYDISDEDEEDNGNGDNSDSDTDYNIDNSNNSSDISELEKEILGSLTDEQLSIKYKELKRQYINIYSTIDTLLIRVNKIPKNTNSIKVVEFILNKLTELKELVVFYLTNTFDTKSYIENTINYQQYLAILNSMTKLFKEINIKNEN